MAARRKAAAHNLPVQLTSFVGREREKAEIKRLLATTRLVTLTGSGGAGKTRLAMEAAREMINQSPDGVWLAELAPLSDPALVPTVVAAAAGLRDEAGRPVLDALATHRHKIRLLLILDNCESLANPPLVRVSERATPRVIRGIPVPVRRGLQSVAVVALVGERISRAGRPRRVPFVVRRRRRITWAG